jgi:hypothetical protein
MFPTEAEVTVTCHHTQLFLLRQGLQYFFVQTVLELQSSQSQPLPSQGYRQAPLHPAIVKTGGGVFLTFAQVGLKP